MIKWLVYDRNRKNWFRPNTEYSAISTEYSAEYSAEYLPIKKYFIPTPIIAQKKAWIWNSTPVPFRQTHIKMCLMINDLDWNSKLSNWILARFAINYTKRYRIKLDFVKRWQKMAWKTPNFRIFPPFFDIRYSAGLAEYSVPNIRLILAEYSAEYSVFDRTLLFTKWLKTGRNCYVFSWVCTLAEKFISLKLKWYFSVKFVSLLRDEFFENISTSPSFFSPWKVATSCWACTKSD